MKNYKFIFFVFILLVTLNFNVVSVKAFDSERLVEELKNYTPELQTGLTKGDRGSDVLEIQNFLHKSEYLPVSPTGYFGTQTESALKTLQDHAGLKPTGVVTKDTIDFLKLDPVVLKDKINDLNNTDTNNNNIKDCAPGDKFSGITGNPCGLFIRDLVLGCEDGFKFSPLSGKPCETTSITATTTTDSDEAEDVDINKTEDRDEDVTITDDTRVLNRIMFWYGKVNQHTDANGNWQTDPDGVSGAGNYAQFGNEGYGDRKLEYCQKFYPKTKSFAPYQLETISTWKERGNVNNWTSIKLSYVCLE